MAFEIGPIFARLGLVTNEFSQGILSAQGLARAFGPVVSTFMANPLLGVIEAGKKMLSMFIDQEQADIRLAAVHRATGGAVGYTVEQLKSQAHAMQELTGTGDQVIEKYQAILMTFKQIKGDQFKDATMAALDLAGALDMDAKSAVMMLGKALNDPIKGVASLSEAGVQFTEQQKAMIKSLVDTNDIMGAQKVILAEIEGQAGGTAEAMGNTLGGKLNKLKEHFGGLMELVGGALAPVLESLIPIVELLGTVLEPVLKMLSLVLEYSPVGLLAKAIKSASEGDGDAAGGGSPAVNVTVSPQDSARAVADKLAPVIERGVKGVQNRVEDSTRRRMDLKQWERNMVL